ncbi:MAG: hypothetical protein PHY54_14560, partial [Methylococcales bacterium]|nr:hypothetical protein [Methylococcales bacterium]
MILIEFAPNQAIPRKILWWLCCYAWWPDEFSGNFSKNKSPASLRSDGVAAFTGLGGSIPVDWVATFTGIRISTAIYSDFL